MDLMDFKLTFLNRASHIVKIACCITDLWLTSRNWWYETENSNQGSNSETQPKELSSKSELVAIQTKAIPSVYRLLYK